MYLSKKELVEKFMSNHPEAKIEDVSKYGREKLMKETNNVVIKEEDKMVEKIVNQIENASEPENNLESIAKSSLEIQGNSDDSVYRDHDIMSMLQPDEIINDANGKPYPKIKGLRRVLQQIYGRIIDEESKVMASPTSSNKVAVVTYQAGLENGDVISASADATEENCGENFSMYLVAMADTRAKAKAYRDKLNVGICAFEEINPNTVITTDVQLSPDKSENGKITGTQAQTLQILAKNTDFKLLQWIKDNGKNSIADMTFEEARALIKTLQKSLKDGITL